MVNEDDANKLVNLITVAKEVMFSLVFVCLFVSRIALQLNRFSSMFTKFSGKVSHGRQKKRLYFG